MQTEWFANETTRATQIRTPRQARNTLAYVLNNWRCHREDLVTRLAPGNRACVRAGLAQAQSIHSNAQDPYGHEWRTIELGAVDEARFLLRARDDGVGVPRELDVERIEFQLVQDLVAQLGRRIEIGRDGGTTFTITCAIRRRTRHVGQL